MTRTLHVRLTPDEDDRLKALADSLGVPVSRLLRRAVREMVNGGPDLFDDGLDAMREMARQLAALARALQSGAHPPDADAARQAAEAARALYAGLVIATRQRWLVARRS